MGDRMVANGPPLLDSVEGIQVTPMRGDVIVVGRRLTLLSWLTNPISTFISWRIQRATGSPWNHVVGYLGSGTIIEADWDRGVTQGHLETLYPNGAFRRAVAVPPSGVNRSLVVERWRQMAGELYRYDWRAIILMRIAAALFGPAGIRKYIRMDRSGRAIHCVAVCAIGWEAGGFAGAQLAFVEPSQFAEAT